MVETDNGIIPAAKTFSGIDETPQNKRPSDGAFCLFRVQRTLPVYRG
jgi:hypothetical protein